MGCRIERSSSFWAPLVSFVEQREPVFGLWLELSGTFPPQRITANLLRPLLSPLLSLSLSLSLSFLFYLSPFYSTHPLLGSFVVTSLTLFSLTIFLWFLYLSRYPLLLSSLILDVVQVPSKRTTGSRQRGSFLSLRLFAHLFPSLLFFCVSVFSLPLSLLLSLSLSLSLPLSYCFLPSSLPRSSLLVQRRTWRLASSTRHFKIPPNLSNRRRVPRKPSLYLSRSRSFRELLFVDEHHAFSCRLPSTLSVNDDDKKINGDCP